MEPDGMVNGLTTSDEPPQMDHPRQYHPRPSVAAYSVYRMEQRPTDRATDRGRTMYTFTYMCVNTYMYMFIVCGGTSAPKGIFSAKCDHCDADITKKHAVMEPDGMVGGLTTPDGFIFSDLEFIVLSLQFITWNLASGVELSSFGVELSSFGFPITQVHRERGRERRGARVGGGGGRWEGILIISLT